MWSDIVPSVDPELCRRCAECGPVAVCLTQGFHREEPGGIPVVDQDSCFGCYSCAGACPHRAIILPRQVRQI